MIVAVFLPIAYAIRFRWLNCTAALIGGSLAIALPALGWFIQCAFDMQRLPF